MRSGDAEARHSFIVEAIADAESGTTGEIRVQLSRRWIERDPLRTAQRLFIRFGMDKTTYRNAVLLYVNLRRRKFALVGDEGADHEFGREFWEKVSRELQEDLRSTYPEKAIAIAVRKIGAELARAFPRGPDIAP